MTIAPDGLYQHGGVPVGGLDMVGIGQVYYVMPSANALYSTPFITKRVGKYPDGTARVHATVQSALDVTVTNRNDYVIVLGNIDLTAALTMTKNRVHLISPVGLKPGAGHPGDWALYATAAADVITITGHRCEVAGFVLLGYEGEDIIDIGTTWDTHIHHNYFGMAATDADTNYGIIGTAPIQPSIHHNMFTNHSPGAIHTTTNDISAFIGITSAGSTRGVISDNILHTGANTVVAAGIACAGYGQFILRNTFWQDAAHGAVDAGTFTKGINCSAEVSVVGNTFGGITAGNCITGATADTCVSNFAGTDGEIRVDPDGSHNYETS